MAKTKSKQNTKTLMFYERKFDQLKDIFPQITVTMWSEKNPGKSGKDFVVDVKIPKNYTLIHKVIASNGEVKVFTFSIQKKYCTGNQRPGVYSFSA